MQVGRDKNISVWRLSDAARDSELENVATALTIQRGQCAQFDYALVDEEELDDLGLTLRKSRAHTPFPLANDLHWDIVDPSATQVCELTRRFGPRDPIFPRELGALIVARLDPSGPTRADLTEEIDAKLVEWGLLPGIVAAEGDRAAARAEFSAALQRLISAVEVYSGALDATRKDRAGLLTAIKSAETGVEKALNHARRVL